MQPSSGTTGKKTQYAELGGSSGQLSTTLEGSSAEINQRTYSEPESVSMEAISPSVRSTGLIVEDATGVNWDIGNCQSWYNRHKYSAVGFRLKDDLRNLLTYMGTGVLCDVVFQYAARRAALLSKLLNSDKLRGAIDGACAWVIDRLINSIEGAVFTLGAWDIDTGWLDWPEVALGAGSGFGVGYWQIGRFITLDSLHLNAI